MRMLTVSSASAPTASIGCCTVCWSEGELQRARDQDQQVQPEQDCRRETSIVARRLLGSHAWLQFGAALANRARIPEQIQQRRAARDRRRPSRPSIDHVGLDAALVNRSAGRREVARGGELDGVTVGQRHHGLHRALAVGLAADEPRAMMILQRAGDDLRCRGRAAVDQHDERRAVQVVAGLRIHLEACIGRATVGSDDQAVVEKYVRHADRRFEHAARIVAQVEHQPAQLAAARLLELGDRGFQVGRRGLAEVRDLHVAEARLEQLLRDAVHLHARARQRELQRLRIGTARDA